MLSATADGGTELRVCAEPANLPFSDRAGRGFENAIAEIIARDLRMQVHYAWESPNKNYVKRTLGAGRCDVLLGVPAEWEGGLTTAPYYRSGYAFVTRTGEQPIRTFTDPALVHARIGIQITGEQYAPPAAILARLGIVRNIRGYPTASSDPLAQYRILEALVKREIDVAIVWGPLAGTYLKGHPAALEMHLAPNAAGPVPMQFSIAFGVKRGNAQLKARLDAALQRKSPSIRRTLQSFGVPLL